MTSINLANLAKIGQLDAVPDSPQLARDKLAVAQTKLADARQSNISDWTRFQCAYDAIREVAEVGLLLRGYRTKRAALGHHMLAIQCLEITLGVEKAVIPVLDRLRRQRHDTGYDADPVTDGELAECVRQAARLVPLGEQALKAKGWA